MGSAVLQDLVRICFDWVWLRTVWFGLVDLGFLHVCISFTSRMDHGRTREKKKSVWDIELLLN